MAEFLIGDVKYRTRLMDARKQFHVARRIAPLMRGLPSITAVQGVEKPDVVASMAPMLGVIAGMEDADLNYVLDACLEVVERENRENATFTPVVAPGGLIMFDDLRTSMSAQLQIVGHVIRENVQGFLAAMPPGFLAKITEKTPT